MLFFAAQAISASSHVTCRSPGCQALHGRNKTADKKGQTVIEDEKAIYGLHPLPAKLDLGRKIDDAPQVDMQPVRHKMAKRPSTGREEIQKGDLGAMEL